MELEPILTQFTQQVSAAAALGDERTKAIADQLATAVSPAVQLAIITALGSAADELTANLLDYPGSLSVGVRVDGGTVRLDVHSQEPPAPAPEARADEAENSARISLRLPESLKSDIEAAAAAENISVNSWLIRSASAGLHPGWGNTPRWAAGWAEAASKHGSYGQRVTGWING
jgi:hypothetical protein